MMHLHDITPIVREWLEKTEFSDAYIFGSLIHKDGVQFDTQISDVDLVCKFSTSQNYIDRWKTVNSAIDPTSHLNLRLLQKLNREDASEPIVSIVPVSFFELESGLHKDKSSQFFSHNRFYNVLTECEEQLGREHITESGEIEGMLDALREAQRYRNKILSIAPSGMRAVEPYEGPDLLPKILSRVAAQTRWAREDSRNAEERFDVNEGFVYMLQLLTARRNESTDVEDLLQRLMIRMGGRGTSGPVDPKDQLLLWEILADDAYPPIPPAIKVNASSTRPRLSRAVRTLAMQRAGMRCCYPGCNVPLGENGIGQIAFISSPHVGGPRYNPDLKEEFLYSADNVVFLCPTHHRLIDSDPDTYTAKEITKWNKIDIPSLVKSASDVVFSGSDLFTVVRLINQLIH